MKTGIPTAATALVGLTSLALTLAACGADSGDAGSGYPERDITLSVGRSPGGSHDTMARQVAPLIEQHLDDDVSVVVKNVPGASGQVAAASLATAEPDGYEIQIVEVEGLAAFQVLEDTDYDVREFTPIGTVNERPAVFAVPVDSEIETWEDLVAAGQDRELLWSTVGSASPNFINGLIVADEVGIQFEAVPHDGATEAVTAAVRGDVDFTVFGGDTVARYVDDGELRAIAQFGAEPLDSLPDVPMGADLGLADFDGVLTAHLIIIAPPNLPDNIREPLAEVVQRALNTEDLAAWAEETGGLVNPGTPQDAERVINDSLDTYKSFADVLKPYIG